MTELLAATPNFKRRILAVGEMRELGASSAELHRAAGRCAVQTGKIDWIIGVSGDAAEIVEGAVAAGFSRAHTKLFDTPEDAAKFVDEFFTTGDLLLVKGSRGVKMERIVETLIAKHAESGATRGTDAHDEVRH
jgi:UDP-N-acetylmuramoyl-tripeptide--D-alanyl-D-alanine ligase